MSNQNNNLSAFGKFRLDPAKRVIWFEEKQLDLPLKAIELLCVLVEKRGELVTKDELLEKVWSNSFVEESNLSRQIYLLRKTFKDLGENDLIENVPRRGYRFKGDVRAAAERQIVIERLTETQTFVQVEEQIEAEPKERHRALTSIFEPRRYRLPVGLAFLIAALIGSFVFSAYRSGSRRSSVTGIKSIAVLPFKTIDGGKENEYQGLGIADLLITRLSNVREINVRPTSAVLNYDKQDITDFGRKLNVDAVLEGTVYRTADKVRVTARLIKVEDASPVWAEKFEKPLQEELRMQDEIALQLVDALALNLSGSEKAALTKRYTESADAHQLYLKGRYEWNKRNRAAMQEADRLFRNAIEKDPNFALAYVGLADQTVFSDPHIAEFAVSKALGLDPSLAEAHASLGFIQIFRRWDWRGAEASFKKSIELNPNYATAHHWYAQVLTIQGRHEEAKAEMRRAFEINPLSHNFVADLGQIYYFNREYDKAEEYCRKALEIYPEFLFAHEYLSDVYLKTGEYDKAVEADLSAQRINSAFAYETVERKQLLTESLDRQRKIYAEGGIGNFIENVIVETQEPSGVYLMATRYAFLGEKEKALDCLEKAYDGRGFLSVFIKADPVFDSLRSEPRYQELLKKMNL